MGKLIWGAGLLAGAGLAGASEYFFRFAILRKPNQGNGPDLDVGTEWEPFLGTIRERKEWLDGQKTERISIRSNDGLRLSGLYIPAERPAKRLVLCFHGYMSCGTNDFAAISPFYHALGYDMLIVDNRAHGESDGKYIGFGCLDRFDCQSWVHYAVDRFGPDQQIVLHGISMGGATVLMAAGLPLPPSVRAIVADCAFTSSWEVFKHVLRRNYHLPPFPLLHITSGLCGRRAGYRFDECSTLDAVRRTKIPILFLHGEKDDFVPTEMSRENYAACASKKQLVIVKGAGHGASYHFDTPLYEESVRSFLEQV